MSSKDVLSEGELDALMDTFSGDGSAPGDAVSGDSCQPFDFSTREQNLLAQIPALKKINEKQSLALVDGIKALYGISTQVEAAETQLLRLDQAISGIADPSGISLVKIAPLNGVSFVVIPGDLLSFFVDKYFGGTQNGASVSSSRKSLTPTELRINEMLTNKFLATLVDAWQEKVQLTPELESFESKPDFLQASSPDELALLFSFAINVGDWSSAIDWIVPYASLEPLRLKLGSSNPAAKSLQKNADWEAHFRRELQFVDLEVSGSFMSGPVSIAEVMNLRPGSIVPLKMPTEVTVSIEDQEFSYGEHGSLNGNKSIKIKEIISHEANSK
ncbi:MAG: flagellar motor switch protein FliM [Bacteroidia bacterium]|jgi:flagellar motor switch protein FliM